MSRLIAFTRPLPEVTKATVHRHTVRRLDTPYQFIVCLLNIISITNEHATACRHRRRSGGKPRLVYSTRLAWIIESDQGVIEISPAVSFEFYLEVGNRTSAATAGRPACRCSGFCWPYSTGNILRSFGFAVPRQTKYNHVTTNLQIKKLLFHSEFNCIKRSYTNHDFILPRDKIHVTKNMYMKNYFFIQNLTASKGRIPIMTSSFHSDPSLYVP